MKKLLLLLTVLTASLAARADVVINTTNFPDANFRNYLLSEYPSGTITTAQLNARTELEVNNRSISNMKGVEYFTQLTRLSCYGNNLTTIDVSSNTKLTYLNVFENKLTSITGLANCTMLEQLYLHYNQLTALSIVNHSALRTLWVYENPNLTTLFCYRNALTNLDVRNCTSLQSFQCFENANLTSINGLATCTAITYFDCEDCAITDLSAVESMPNLAYLYARNNKITTLNVANHSSLSYLRVSGNTLLTTLRCYSCALTTLNVTGCTGLTDLRCYYNDNLTEITGLASCTALTYLDCEDCAITDLPGVNNMNNLQVLWCRNNQLTQLEVTEKSQLKYLRVSGNAGLTFLNCHQCALTSLDVTDCTALEDFDCSDNASLTSITGLATCTALQNFSAEYCALNTSLDMTFCPDLRTLYCYHNNLTGLDVTGLSELIFLNCMQNANLADITGLAACTKMTYLECSECALTSLQVSSLSALEELWCRNNQFTTLSVYSKPNLTTLIASGNSLLEELECYDCALTRLEIYDCPVLNYLDCEYNQLTELDTYTCPELMYLLCNSNKITQLDLSSNDQIVYLWCNENKLTSLDVSHFSEDFRSLDCRYNQITGTIDVSRFSQLFQLACSSNQISQLTLGDHPELQDIWCYDNQLTSLDVSDLPVLQTLYCHYNQLTSLNVNNCPSLKNLYVYYNQINASKMGQVVTGLPTRSNDAPGIFIVFVDPRYDENLIDGNVITVSQVNQANAKYWDVYWWDTEAPGWELYPGSAILRGDVDDDGNVNIDDVTALIDYLLGTNDNINVQNADVDESGDVSIDDVTALIDILLGLSSKVMAPNGERSGSSIKGNLVSDKELVLEKPSKIRQ